MNQGEEKTAVRPSSTPIFLRASIFLSAERIQQVYVYAVFGCRRVF